MFLTKIRNFLRTATLAVMLAATLFFSVGSWDAPLTIPSAQAREDHQELAKVTEPKRSVDGVGEEAAKAIDKSMDDDKGRSSLNTKKMETQYLGGNPGQVTSSKGGATPASTDDEAQAKPPKEQIVDALDSIFD